MKTADLLVSEGYADAGYQYVIVDDCWLSKNRTADGKLEADKIRFPSGIKALSDYVSLHFHVPTEKSVFSSVLCRIIICTHIMMYTRTRYSGSIRSP